MSATPEPAPELTAADIAVWVTEAEWSYAPDGLGTPHTVALTGGVGSDDLGRPYSLGEAVGADLDGDGVIDAAIPITMVDGNAVHELWYIWRGIGVDSDPVAEQVIYPISRTTRCGDVTRAVTAVDGGLQLDVVLWMPHTDAARSCAEGGTGVLTRVIELSEIEGQFYPVQTAPVTAWGGVCPPTEWLDGSPEMGLATRVAPPASAPAATDPNRSAAVFGLREAPLLTAGGGSFFGFIQDYVETDPVRMHCAFAD
ncbi:hypothetical protein [Microbacterium memoriense]|uniref:VCBS repeat-containing protein n=1 Tax=Microbacterium memoriense TaxID=2978350 RepID=A0ABT2PDU2_9MICO|nr:hypothetical protein [Microbacterium memoriense]MCT9002605.1 hypothetical protein [Microbacterium memoriense]